ncbi:MAG: hypothetical protein ACSNEK_00265 [Parachlamydiaceae bacterium]
MRALAPLLCLILFCLYPISVWCEIEKVSISWTAMFCKTSCVQLLSSHFSRVKGVDDININQQAGIAELKWNPSIPFSYRGLATSMGLLGLSIKDIRVKVKGTVRASGKYYQVISTGDRTPFTLLSPATPYKNAYVVQSNPANRELHPEMRQRLHEAQLKQELAVVEGPLFMPERSPPLMIVIEQISFIDQSQSESKKKNVK